ncbi:abortive infection family protein [Chromobacterium violaceum]|uniref:abortive infection family protein n=1 Tax=Chromobacterium violaceum TaxID=536 RepID=UPI0035A69794
MFDRIDFSIPKQKGRVLLALQNAIIATFTQSDWKKFGYQTGYDSFITQHPRLLRSLSWQDEDYADCVLQALEHFYNRRDTGAFESLFTYPELKNELEKTDPALLSELGYSVHHVQSIPPKSLSASEVVETALHDAEQLLRTSGPLSAVDRLHTALHGYIKYLCTSAGLTIAPDSSITSLFKTLRTDHPKFQIFSGTDVERILQGFSTTIDAVNTIRNRQSVAHPNENLLGDDEAHLVVNAIRTIFHYLQTKAR